MIVRDGRRPATSTSAPAPARARAARWAIAMLGVLGALSAGGCSDSAPHGPPVLLQVYWESRGGVQTLVWSKDPTDSAVTTDHLPPAATQFDLVFDRVIDGSKIEDTVIVNGVSTQVPKATPPVSVSWPDMLDANQQVVEPAGQNYGLTVWYNSVHLSAPGVAANTTYVYGREVPSYPSNTTLSINIPAANITSKYNEPMEQVDPIMLTTAPFSLAINPTANAPTANAPMASAADDAGVPSPTYVPTNFWVPLQFNNIPVDVVHFADRLPQYLHVTQNGVPLSAGQYRLQASTSDPTLILLQPGSIQIWDSGARLDVTVTADLPDVYGAVLGQDMTASFIPCQLVGEDAGVRICAPPMHGGGADGGAPDGVAADAASDVPVSPDAGIDAADAGADGAD